MPLYKTIHPNNHTTVYVWKIEASFDELSENILLTDSSEKRLYSMNLKFINAGI